MTVSEYAENRYDGRLMLQPGYLNDHQHAIDTTYAIYKASIYIPKQRLSDPGVT